MATSPLAGTGLLTRVHFAPVDDCVALRIVVHDTDDTTTNKNLVLTELKIEQAIAREALRLAFIQHKEFAVALKGVQQERTIADAFRQSGSGESLVKMMELGSAIIACALG